MSVKIIPVEAGSERMAGFYGLCGEIYRGDSFYRGPPADAVRKSVERDVFRSRQKIFMAYSDGNAAARLIARISPELKDEKGLPTGMIGFYESLDSMEAAKLILNEAVAWLRNSGAGEIIGPIDGDTWHRYRFNIGPFDSPPFMMEPYNPAYYPVFWERSGFEPLSCYYSKHVPDIEQTAKKSEKYFKRTVKSGFTFRNFRTGDFKGEMKILYNLSRGIFSDSYLYTGISWDDFLEMYSGAASIMDSRLIWFAQDRDGRYAGFVFSFPDCFKAVAADVLNVKTLGTVPEYRGAGLGMALMHKAYASGMDAGFRRGNLCLIREGNSSGRMDMESGYISRRYVLYRFAGERQ